MELTREEALQYIHDNPQQYLQKARVEGYICPICGSGSGPNGTGITTKDGKRYTCWAGKCFTSADIPDIIAAKEGLTPGSREALQRAYEVYSLTIGKKLPSTGENKPSVPPAQKEQKAAQDFTAYIEECHARIGQTDYPQRRGFTKKIIERFRLGYEPNFRTKETLEDGTERFVTWKALIIPNLPYGYKARNTNPDAADKVRPRGITKPFNLQALQQQEKPVFIVEGELDALSIAEVGGEAVALGGTGNVEKLLAELPNYKITRPLLLALDKDEAGRNAEEKLAISLRERGLPFLQADITGEYKDANEAYNGPGLADFALAVSAAMKAAKTEQEEALEAERAAYMKINAAASMEGFFAEIAEGKKAFPTGLERLDKELKGGIFAGLTIIGALTSAGKTTLTMQIADYMAQAGHDVLIFSLETGKHELMAKSISRETLLECFRRKIPDINALPYRDILNGERDNLGIFEAACGAYSQYARNVYIFQSLGKIGTKRIREEMERHKLLTGKTPVIIVDYLQLLGTNDSKYHTEAKETMDSAVTELKCMSVDFKTPVMLISSFNRNNYKTDANFASFKESGGIEYSADLLLGLQYVGAGKQGFTQEKLEELSGERIRKMELKIMKYRGGEWGQRILFDYYAFANYFRETGVKKGRDK